MTNNSPFNSDESSSGNDLGFDDFIGILVAFLTIGTVLFWSLSRESSWNAGKILPIIPGLAKIPAESNQDDILTKLLLEPSLDNDNLGSRERVIPAEPIPRRRNPVLLEREAADAVIPPFLVTRPRRELPRDLDRVVPGVRRDGDTTGNAIIAKPEATNTPTPTQTPTQTPTPTQSPSVQARATRLPTIPPPIAFRDVPQDFWAKPFINKLSSRKVIEGYPDFTYRPLQPVNRAEFASIIENGFQTDITNTQKVFKDVPDDFWGQNAIKKAVATKFMTGYPDNSFKPEQQIPRVQAIVSLVSGLNLKTPASVDQVLSVYKDADQIPEWAREKVAAATVNNLVVNYPDPQSFNPNQPATRADVAGMVHQALVKTKKVDPVKSQYVVGK